MNPLRDDGLDVLTNAGRGLQPLPKRLMLFKKFALGMVSRLVQVGENVSNGVTNPVTP